MADLTHVDTGTKLAVDRTRLAYERTLMAWLRTAASMISFGFTIYKFFQFELKDRPPQPDRFIGPREFALILITIGLVALLLSTIEHRNSMKRLRAEYGIQVVPLSVATVVAALFSVLGILALLATWLHW